MLSLVALLFVGVEAPSLDEALRNIETEHAKAKGRQEQSLAAIEKAIKSTPRTCPKQDACPVCPEAIQDDSLEARVAEVMAQEKQVSGRVELWRIDLRPAEKLAESPFAAPVPPPRLSTTASSSTTPVVMALVCGLAVGATGAFLYSQLD